MLSQKLGAVLFLAASILPCLEASRIHLKTRELNTAQEPSGFLSPVRRANPLRRHILVDFQNPINPELLAELTARNIVVTSALGENGLALSVPEDVRLEDLGVVWTGQLLPSDKLSPELDKQTVRARERASQMWIVEFHNDVDPALAARVLSENGLTVVPNPDLIPGDFLVSGERSSLTGIADFDEVAYIFPASPEMVAGRPLMPCSGALTQGGTVAQYVTIGNGWTPNTSAGLRLNYVYTTLTSKVPAAQVESEIVRAMNQWSAITNVQFQADTNAGDPYTVAIEFGTSVNGDPNPFTSLSTMAHTYYPAPPNPEPIAGDMHFNPAENWHVGSTTDVYTVALHELGHSLGLGHTDDPVDVMYPYYHFGTPLSPNDIAGVQSMYGLAGGNVSGGATHPAVPSVISVIVHSPADGSSTNSATETFSGSVLNPHGAPSVSWQSSGGQSGHAVPNGDNWTAAIPLAAGSNMITVTATDSSGNSVSRVVRVTRDVVGSTEAGVVSSGGSVPVIVVTSPPNGISTTASSLAIAGTAGDSNGLENVSWRTNSQASGIATGTSNWSASGIPLFPGQNTIIVQATNINGVARWVTLTITKE
jgi:hypothetical protein